MKYQKILRYLFEDVRNGHLTVDGAVELIKDLYPDNTAYPYCPYGNGFGSSFPCIGEYQTTPTSEHPNTEWTASPSSEDISATSAEEWVPESSQIITS